MSNELNVTLPLNVENIRLPEEEAERNEADEEDGKYSEFLTIKEDPAHEGKHVLYCFFTSMSETVYFTFNNSIPDDDLLIYDQLSNWIVIIKIFCSHLMYGIKTCYILSERLG